MMSKPDMASRETAFSSAPFEPAVVAERTVVVAHEEVNSEYRFLAVRASPVAAAAKPGQFFNLLCPEPPGLNPFLRRPMSLYGSDPALNRVEFLYKIVGAGTRGLTQLSVGDELDVVGPLGRGFRFDPAWRSVVLVGRGVGLATLAPVCRAVKAGGANVTALLSARSRAVLVSAAVMQSGGADVVPVFDEDGSSAPAKVERLLRDLIEAGRCDALFTCGSARLARLMKTLALEYDLPAQIAMEQHMACGLGLCHVCVRDFDVGGEIVSRRVCWDGPVFDLREALP
ncbi:MAG: dihydroorotate dehydrogenase electron transfer subunit [Methylobacteriaceae bacterium]|jgi:dihydroorotate dehydrogenase electron transfer subunit|nr:dihydroorotate dehydrogenase electron transfer subunit [Methylobacteriaceae bacterium]